MQSTVFYERLKQILDALDVDGFVRTLYPILIEAPNVGLSSTRNELPAQLFKARSTLDALSEDPENKQIISQLGLRDIFSDGALANMITTIGTTNDAHSLRNNAIAFQLLLHVLFSFRDISKFGHCVPDADNRTEVETRSNRANSYFCTSR